MLWPTWTTRKLGLRICGIEGEGRITFGDARKNIFLDFGLDPPNRIQPQAHRRFQPALVHLDIDL